ncbi:L-threonylcarbamoyladenylate synthase [Patescibacteria group bacterium]
MIDKAVDFLRGGGVVIFPTDTVWGIGAWIESDQGLEKLYRLKEREKEKPTAILIGDINQAGNYGLVDGRANELMIKHWPGALTLIIPANERVPKILVNSWGGVGVRYPKSKIVEEICIKLPGGIVASSANVSGGMAPKSLGEINKYLLDKADYTMREAGVLSGKSSTVVDLVGRDVEIIRQGEVVMSKK